MAKLNKIARVITESTKYISPDDIYVRAMDDGDKLDPSRISNRVLLFP